ncbi:MAG TPA: carbohydrate porin [Stenomitos sp.]|uniref:Carbohydrate porin n=1 Tax=Aerosakkonema funiforme FACHB-1375 TaxID=2949571 RepID=A0A926VIF9_9CYAN|nr:carbohydrate porin [Aerosakkonema funiforme]MBD2184393.1 carbohydrate porin [Aerosakkonema funiforme FACHB-1375]
MGLVTPTTRSCFSIHDRSSGIPANNLETQYCSVKDFSLFLADLGKAGSQLSFVFGMPPKVIDNDIYAREDPDTSLHLELSYSYPISNKIFLISGFLVITNPEHNSDNSPVWVGSLRTSLIF